MFKWFNERFPKYKYSRVIDGYGKQGYKIIKRTFIFWYGTVYIDSVRKSFFLFDKREDVDREVKELNNNKYYDL